MELLSEIYGFVIAHFGKVGAIVLVVAFFVWTGLQTFLSRIKPGDLSRNYFTHGSALSLPRQQLGYGNRMAYLMAELSYLAYFEFENAKALVPDAVKKLLAQKDDLDEQKAEAFITRLIDDTLSSGGEAVLGEILEKNGLELLQTLNRGPVQAFVCKNNRPGQNSFLVVSFRGSEKKVNDWLTNAKAAPRTFESGAKVHTGFYESFNKVEDELTACIEKHGTGEGGSKLPVYFTGHSLGGAWALLATRLICPSHPGACYNFGAPRIANYDFFLSLSRPVFRVVNSADIVPRVPPGVLSKVLYWILKGLSKLVPIPIFSSLLDKAASFFNRLKDYRHYGDQRYLTDVRNGRFEDTELLQNPHMADRILWFWKSVLAGITFPVKSHSITIYRDKLAVIAARKND